MLPSTSWLVSMFDGTKKELQKGDNLVLGPLVGGHKMTSNRPIQVDLVAGDIGSKYELRWFAQVDSGTWTKEYFAPVAETTGTSGFWFYNPNMESNYIHFDGGNIEAAGSFTVPYILIPLLHFYHGSIG